MSDNDVLALSSRILAKARALGASLAGFADIDNLKAAPSFRFAPRMPASEGGVGIHPSQGGLKPGEVAWPAEARSVLVIAVAHPEAKPEMDWWFGPADPPGNRILADIVRRLCAWIGESSGIKTVHLPYATEKGGTFLKDAAVLAGLGCIGRNNLLVTPEYGPRVRLRALTLDARMPQGGPSGFDPCAHCDNRCRKACPQGAFTRKLYTAWQYGQSELPARTGDYSRPSCNVQMEKDEAVAVEETVEGFEQPAEIIRYCRSCELSCPVGRGI